MTRRLTALIAGSMLLASCTTYQIEPLSTDHPANPGAPSSPEPSPSQTLAYTRSDIPAIAAVSPRTAAPSGNQNRSPEAVPSRTVVGEGEVVATVPDASQIVLEHGEIQGFMETMTMGYRIDPPALLGGLKPGDRVRFTIDVQKRTITAIEKLN